MSTFREKATLLIAAIVLLFCFSLIFMGMDGELKAIIGLVVGFYFGQYLPVPQGGDNGQGGATGNPA